MKKIMMTLVTIVVFINLVGIAKCQTLNKQQNDFFKTVQQIRKSIGMMPLIHSKKLQSITNRHGEVIKKEGVLMVKEGVSVSTLGIMKVVMSCNATLCTLQDGKYVQQSPKDEAYSLFWRKEDIGKLFNHNSKRMAVTIIHRINKPDVVIAMASK